MFGNFNNAFFYKHFCNLYRAKNYESTKGLLVNFYQLSTMLLLVSSILSGFIKHQYLALYMLDALDGSECCNRQLSGPHHVWWAASDVDSTWVYGAIVSKVHTSQRLLSLVSEIDSLYLFLTLSFQSYISMLWFRNMKQ